jgi:hypothetical protein
MRTIQTIPTLDRSTRATYPSIGNNRIVRLLDCELFALGEIEKYDVFAFYIGTWKGINLGMLWGE